MKKLLLAIFLFSIGWIVFPAPTYAATYCGNTLTEGQCDILGGCSLGQKCTFGIDGNNTCVTSSSCPNTGIVCGIGGVVGGCGPSNGCESGKKCQVDLGTGNYYCSSLNASSCSTNSTSTSSTTTTASTSVQSSSATTETLSVNNNVCSNNGTVYPPNSTCYNPAGPKVEAVAANLASLTDSNSSILAYPLTCVSAPVVTYSQTVTGYNPPANTVDVNISSDVSNAQLGFLGPDSTTLATSNPDSLAKNYLFNALFDRPSADPESSRESFRTFWRMLDSLSQAQLKAYYIQNVNNFTYYYVGTDKKQHSVKIEDLRKALPSCLKSFADKDCWINGGTGDTKYYLNDYLSLNSTVRDEYDALLPFDFNNMRGYLSNGTTISKENIPYLRAILTGLKGYREDITIPYYIPGIGYVKIPNTVVPGLFDYYTPSWADEPLALYPTISNEETSLIQYPVIKVASLLNNSCVAPTSSSSVSSPKTYTDPSSLSQTVTVPVSSTLISSTPDHYECSTANNTNGFKCVLVKGTNTYHISGSAVGKPITVFNNPYITSLTDLVAGGKSLVSNTSNYKFVQAIVDAINKLSDKLISPVQPSFYKMLLPDFASESAKTYVSAPEVDTSTDNPNATAYGSDTLYRENNLAQDEMFNLQNCWLVPNDQQSSSKCGKSPVTVGACALSETPLTGSCNKTSFAKYTVGYGSSLSSYIPNISPELSAVYAEAEKQTGVSCVILAAVHYMEGGNDSCKSLISGRKLGTPEPDKGGKVYSTLLETAIDAGNELAGKGATGASSQDVIKALSYYNGNGNANCRINWSLPNNVAITPKYSIATGQCPPSFPGEDDPYAVSLLDTKHSSMYLRCPADHDCSAVLPFGRPGAFTVALNYYNSLP